MPRTGTDIDKIRQVSQHTAPRSPRVSGCRIRLLDSLDIPRGHRRAVITRDPIFWSRMAVSPGAWWELGDHVVSMRGAVECTLAGDVLGQFFVADSRGAKGVLYIVNIAQGPG